MVARSDEANLAHAAASGRVLHTFNMTDFYELHGQFTQTSREHAGLVLCTQQRYAVGEQMRKLHRLRAEWTTEEMQNHVLFLISLEGQGTNVQMREKGPVCCSRRSLI